MTATARHSFPDIVVHCDWSIRPKKRYMVRAQRRRGRYTIHPPELVPLAPTKLLNLAGSDQSLFIGLDVPIGLPVAYAQQISCDRFMDLLPQLGSEEWKQFFQPATTADEISLQRPFYPQRPGGTRRDHLVAALNLGSFQDLYRRCDLPTAYRSAGATLFWTMGAQQVGKAAITAWRDLLQPILSASDASIAVWPFEGRLEHLLTTKRVTIAEVYPGEMGYHLLAKPRSKRKQADRQTVAEQLLNRSTIDPINFLAESEDVIKDGFGDGPTGEDQFDAMSGLLGMLGVINGSIPAGEPSDRNIRVIEGGILGCEMD